MTIRSFDSVDEMFTQMDDDREAADAAVRPEQEKIAVGDCFLQYAHGFMIYGEVIDPAKRVDGQPFHNAAEERDYVEDAKLYQQPHMKHYRFARCFSSVCPDGELGSVHVSTLLATTRAFLDRARAAGWPSTPNELDAIALECLRASMRK